MTIEQGLELAVRLQQENRLAEAEELYRQILKQNPDHAEALSQLSVLVAVGGQNNEALELGQRAVTLAATQGGYHSNLGMVLARVGRTDEAIKAFREAARLAPTEALFQCNLGVALLEREMTDEAVSAFERAATLNPRWPEPLLKLAAVLRRQNRLAESIGAYQRVLQIDPSSVESLNGMAEVQRLAGDLEGALGCLQQAVALQPGSSALRNNLGNVLIDQGRSVEAVAAYRKALELQPNFLLARNNLARGLQIAGDFDEAAACSRGTLERYPDSAKAWANLGGTLREQMQLPEALRCLDRAIELDPAQWAVASNRLFCELFDPEADDKVILNRARQFNARYAEALKRGTQRYKNIVEPGRRIRVGYVSPNFWTGHCQSLFTVPLLAHHDRERCEVICYEDSVHRQSLASRFPEHVWRATSGLSDEALARLIETDQIDILVDLTMHMANNRPLLFARKPAPIQVAWLAYPGTTGLAAMDYRFTDPYLDPPGKFDERYSEESIRLPETFWCFDPMAPAGAVPVTSLPAAANGHVTFGSLNHFSKVNPPTLELWSRILRQMPRAKMLLLAPRGETRGRVMAKFEYCGVRREQVEFVDRKPREQYLETYNRIDVCLDTFPYNAHTTALDALWMGVPTLTYAGETVVGRAGRSQLSNLRMAEFCAGGPDDFVALALRAAGDIGRLAEVRRELRERMRESPLMQAGRFARNIGDAYCELWRRWCDRQH